MRELPAEELKSNYDALIKIIKSEISEPRSTQLLKLYNQLEERIMMAPASGNINYHNCFIGGYVDHVLNVVESAKAHYEMWKALGADNSDYTYEELIFSAINHDLGKIGDLDNEYYIPNPSEWHRKNLGKIYEHNKNLAYMRVADRSLYLLQESNIKISRNEFLAIKLHDGLYVDDNKAYLFAGGQNPGLQNHLPYMLHHADHVASIIEKEKQKNNSISGKEIKKVSHNITNKQSRIKSIQNIAKSNNSINKNHANLFDELFKDL
jgi:hypothetical protein